MIFNLPLLLAWLTFLYLHWWIERLLSIVILFIVSLPMLPKTYSVLVMGPFRPNALLDYLGGSWWIIRHVVFPFVENILEALPLLLRQNFFSIIYVNNVRYQRTPSEWITFIYLAIILIGEDLSLIDLLVERILYTIVVPTFAITQNSFFGDKIGLRNLMIFASEGVYFRALNLYLSLGEKSFP